MVVCACALVGIVPVASRTRKDLVTSRTLTVSYAMIELKIEAHRPSHTTYSHWHPSLQQRPSYPSDAAASSIKMSSSPAACLQLVERSVNHTS